MKTISAILATLFLSSNVHAKATLRIPLFLDAGKPVSAAEINTLIVKAGGEALPEFIEISENENGSKKLKALDGRIAEALKLLGPDYQFVMRASEYVPGTNNRGELKTCYRGDANDVIHIVESLADAAYSDQMNLFGSKFKKETHYYQDMEEGELDSFLREGSKRWTQWTGEGDDILILASIGDSGDDVQEALIPLCR
jgi:hypothetical protein